MKTKVLNKKCLYALTEMKKNIEVSKEHKNKTG